MSRRGYDLDEVDRQIDTLSGDLLTLTPPARAAARRVVAALPPVRRVVLLGSGDSLYAAQAALPAFASAGVVGLAMSATEFLHHPPTDADQGLVAVVGVSASGGNPSVLAAITRARADGWDTAAITCDASGPLAAAAADAVVVDPGRIAPSPGLRTYQAVLLGLLHLADAAGDGGAGLGDLDALADAQARSLRAVRDAAHPVAQLLAPAPLVHVVAGASMLPTARFLAAKLTETAGVPTLAAELEDWWHVHRFGHDDRHPVVFFCTPGADREPSLAFAERTARRRPLVVVADAADEEARSPATAVVPVVGDVRVAARPLRDLAVAGPLAHALAARLGRLPFACQ